MSNSQDNYRPQPYDLLSFDPNFESSVLEDYSDSALEDHYIFEILPFQSIVYNYKKRNGFNPENGSELFVKHISNKTNVTELLRHFQQIGAVFQIRLMMSENLKYNRGFAYVTYMNSALAKKAINQLNYKPLNNSHLNLETSLNNRRIFLGGIPVTKSKDEIWQQLIRQGIQNLVDVIMYRSYTDRAFNRGFVFLEFKTHEDAARFRARYAHCLYLWDRPVVIDWSVPMPEIDEETMKKVKILYIRNLDVCQSHNQLQGIIHMFVTHEYIEKIFKFKNYAFIHLKTRSVAEHLLRDLTEYYRDTIIEVEWAKPPNKFTSQTFRQRKLSTMAPGSRFKYNSTKPSYELQEQVTSDIYMPRCTSTPNSSYNIFEPKDNHLQAPVLDRLQNQLSTISINDTNLNNSSNVGTSMATSWTPWSRPPLSLSSTNTASSESKWDFGTETEDFLSVRNRNVHFDDVLRPITNNFNVLNQL